MDRFYLQLHITDKCGNRCKHCYQSHYNGSDMCVTLAKDVLSELSSIGNRMNIETQVSITGGDPLLHPDFFEILRFSKEYCDKVYVLGNPELLSNDTVENLGDIGIDLFQLSLDGTMKTHDENRSKGSFKRTCRAIMALKKAGIKVGVNMTLTNKNRGSLMITKKVSLFYGASYFSSEECIPFGEDCNGRNSHPCSLGFSVMTILPDMTIMACRRSPSSVLGEWKNFGDLEYFFVKSPKMVAYRYAHNGHI